MNIPRTIIVAGIDLVILLELALAMYISAQGGPADMPALFLKIFVPGVVVTLLFGRLLLKKLRI